MPILDRLTYSVPSLSSSCNYCSLLLHANIQPCRLLGHNRYLQALIFISFPHGTPWYLSVTVSNHTKITASISFPQKVKPYWSAFQWGVVLPTSELHSVFVVSIIGGHSRNWESICRRKCQVSAICSAKCNKVLCNKWSQGPHAFQNPVWHTCR